MRKGGKTSFGCCCAWEGHGHDAPRCCVSDRPAYRWTLTNDQGHEYTLVLCEPCAEQLMGNMADDNPDTATNARPNEGDDCYVPE